MARDRARPVLDMRFAINVVVVVDVDVVVVPVAAAVAASVVVVVVSVVVARFEVIAQCSGSLTTGRRRASFLVLALLIFFPVCLCLETLNRPLTERV